MRRLRRAALHVTALEDRLTPVGAITEQIIVDQIGWRNDAAKVIVFADPVNGQNAAITYIPGSTFQVRRANDDGIAFTGSVVQWNGGATDDQSGDRAWHGDFTSLTTAGDYYIYDATNNLRSYAFSIRSDIYNPVLTTAGRVFYYQRSGTALPAQYAGNWTHGIDHVSEKTALQIIGSTPQAGTARDVSGGWWDAGDYNKYVAFTTGPVWDLLTAYEWNAAAFGDNWNVPESGNGIPDILDQVKWEIDWLLKMQLSNGSVLNRVGQTSYDVGTSPETDTQPHYYTAATTWATASAAASFAHASRVFASLDSTYAATLRVAAEKAWTYLTATPNMFPTNGLDGGNLAAADGGSNANADRRVRVLAAAELWALTGSSTYKAYFEAIYKSSNLSENGYHPINSGAFDASLATDLNRALITYAKTAGASTTIVNEIKTAVKNAIDWNILPNQSSDPYLSFMWDGHYTWGSNQLKAQWAELLLYGIQLGVGTSTDRTLYRRTAEEYLHYFHGRNPLSYTYLSNASSIGGDKSPMQVYHSWWPDGSAKYDGATSQFGPAPGYVVGGANQFFTRSWITPPYGMPPMKAYRDWNTVWNEARQDTENSWELNEPAIYSQAAYVFLVSQFATSPTTSPPPPPPPPAGTLQFTTTGVSVNEGAGTASVTVSRTGGSFGSVSVSFATANGTAFAPGDFGASNGTLTWADGDTSSKTITVPIVNDASVEANETFSLALSSVTGGAAIGANGTSVVTIVDNDVSPPPPTTTANLGGKAFLDIDADGVKDASDPAISGITVYLDLNNNGILDGSDPSRVTDAVGSYQFNSLAAGNYTVREVLRGATTLTGAAANGSLAIALAGGVDQLAANFGHRLIAPIFPTRTTMNLFTTSYPNSNTAYVYNVFRALLGKDPTAGEVAYHVNALNSGYNRTDYATSIYNRDESLHFQVDQMYRNILKRPADDAGKVFWSDHIRRGLSPEWIVSLLAATSEYQSTHTTNASYIQGLYNDLLCREPTSADIAFWNNFLATRSRFDLAWAFASAAEAYTRAVKDVFVQFLHREATPADVNHWVNLLMKRQVSVSRMSLLLIASSEFAGKAANASG